MKIEQVRPTTSKVTLHSFELAALMASARWIVEGCLGEVPGEAREQLRGILDGYDQELSRHRSAEPARTHGGEG